VPKYKRQPNLRIVYGMYNQDVNEDKKNGRKFRKREKKMMKIL
jgi:hypothetical protein